MMRKEYISIRKSFLWLLLLMIFPVVQSYAQLSTKASTSVMLIDADPTDWWGIPSDTAKIFTAGGTEPLYQGASDFSVTFKTAWDGKKIYFYAEIKDDVKVKTGTFYLMDNLELWLDVNNSKGTTFDGVDDIKIRINRDTVLVNSAVGNNTIGDYPWTSTSKDGMRGMIIKQKEVAGGYIVELSVPWDSIQQRNTSPVVIGEGTTIGFNAYFCDQDSLKDSGAERTKLVWQNTTAGNPSTWGTTVLTGTPAVTELASPATTGLILVDADVSDWFNVPSVPVAVVNYGAANWVDAADFSGSFKTTWDNKNFYFYADIKDDIKVKAGAFYLVDNFELSLDVNNSKGAAFDKVDDVKIRINRDTTLVPAQLTFNDLGDYPWLPGYGMKGMVIKQKEVAGGWQVELSIPWDSIQSQNTSPVAIGEGSVMGIQVYLCDQDDAAAGGATRTKLLWINATGGVPATWGSLVLNGTPVEPQVKVYEQRFINLTGANADASIVGWKAYTSLQSTEILSTAGFQGGISGGVGTVISSDDNDKGYIFLYTDKQCNLLSISNTRITRSENEVTEIGFVMRDLQNGFAYTSQVAVRVAGQWYVNEEVFNVNTPAPAVTTFTWRSFAWKTSGWKKLVFDQSDATTLAISADPAGDLPEGNLENFGIFSIHPATGGSVVVDEVYVVGGANGGPFDAVAPAVPTAIAAADPALAAINLSWAQVSDNETGTVTYNVYNGLQLLVGSTTSLSYSVSGLEWETEYTFYVTSKDLSGNESDFSAVAVATTIADPATGIAQNTLKSSVYPNPVNDLLNVSAINIYKVELFNALGSKVLSEKALNENSHSINMSNLAKGIYLLKIYDKVGHVSTTTVAKE